jgi:tetratricopeptide (TPR) repeat protein
MRRRRKRRKKSPSLIGPVSSRRPSSSTARAILPTPTSRASCFWSTCGRYPADAQAGDAQYYAGDCFLQAKRYKEAALAFQKVPDQYPKSQKSCDARYKLGLCFIGLKLPDDARAALEETLSRCSGKVSLAKQAKARLAELNKGEKGRRPSSRQ